MIQVKPNRFFLRGIPPSGSMIPLLAESPDLSLVASSAVLDFSTGDRNKNFLVSGNSNNSLTAGQYDLIGGHLRAYVSGADVTTTGQGHSLSLFVFKDDYPVSEGGLSIPTNTSASPSEVIYSNTYEEGGNVIMSEDFDGMASALNFSLAPMQGYLGSDPFIWYDDAVDKYANYVSITRKAAKRYLKPYRTFDPRDQDANPSISFNTSSVVGVDLSPPDYTKSMGGLGRRGGGIARIYLRPHGTTSDAQTDTYGEGGVYTQTHWKPMKRRDDGSIKKSMDIKFGVGTNSTGIKDLIQYGSMHPLIISDDSEERQTTNNTIFDSIFSSRMVHNPWNADNENPLVYSLINLSKTEGQGTGNAARFYHSWDFASGSQDADGGKTAIEIAFGRSGDVNGQVARVGISNIPIPLITDCGLDSDNSFAVSDRRTYFPEISMSMRIDKLGATPFYGVTSNPTKYSKTNMNPLGGDTGTNQAMVYGLASGTTLQAREDEASITVTDYASDKTESLLRSVVITFSNYTAEDVSLKAEVTLDEFLNYGLNNFYIKQQTKHGIVGGLMFRTYGSMYDDTGSQDAVSTAQSYPLMGTSEIFAQAIPVMRNFDRAGINAVNGSGKLFENGGLIRLCNGFYDRGWFTDSTCDVTANDETVGHDANYRIKEGYRVSGTDIPAGAFIKEITSTTEFELDSPYTGSTDSDVTLTFTNPNEYGGASPEVTGEDYLLRIGVDSWIDAYESQLGADGAHVWAGPPLWQKVPFNSFFNLRFFWDILASNSDASFSNTPYSVLNASAPTNEYASQGPICRVFLETEGGNSPPDLSATDEYKFIDIPFPCNPDDDTTTGSPAQFTKLTKLWSCLDNETGELNADLGEANAAKLWPRHMTIWINNYRYIVGGNNSRRETELLNGGTDDYYYYGDVSAVGGTQETEVFIDNISFKNFTPSINNHTSTNTAVDTWRIGSASVESPLYNITGSGSGTENARRLISFNAVSGTNAGGQNVASYRTLFPSQNLIFGWDDPTDLPATGTNLSTGYCLLGDFSTLDFNNINQFNYPMWTNFAEGGFLSMASNVVTNDVDTLGHQYMGAHYISGTVQVQYGEMGTSSSFNNLSGALYSIVDTGTVQDNKMTIASGANTFLSTDAFTQKGFAHVSVSGNAGDDTTVDYGNWGKREHAGVSVKVTGYPRGDNSLKTNQVRVSDTSIFNEFINDEFIIYRAHASNSTATRLTGLRLRESGAIVDNVITFNKSVVSSDSGGPYMDSRFHSEIYISPRKYWITMTYPGDALYGSSNDKVLSPRSYSSLGFVDGTPDSSALSTYTGSTFNENLYSYNTAATGTVGLSSMSNRMWDFELDDEESVFELSQDWGFGAYDAETQTGGEVDTKVVLSGSYIDFNLAGPIDTQTIKEDQTFLMYWKMNGKNDNAGIDLYSPASADTQRKPRFYWEYVDVPPPSPEIFVEPAINLVEKDVDLYELTKENLSAVKFTWSEAEDDIWYRYMIMSTGNVANKYHGARLWIPLNEEPQDQNLANFSTTYNVYDVVSGTSTSLTNGAGGPTGTAVDGVTQSEFRSTLGSDLTGIAGWAPIFSSGSGENAFAYLPSGGNFDFPFQNAAETEKFSVMVHGQMVSGTSSQWNFILSKGVDANTGTPTQTGLSIAVSGANSNTPKVQVCHAGTFLYADSILPNDGSSFNIIYTYNSGSAAGPDAKLYVDGVLEGYADTMPALPTTDKDLFIGTALDTNVTNLWKYSGSPTAADGARVEGTYDNIAPNATDGSGVIANTKFRISVASDGKATFYLLSGGSGYAVDDTLTFIASQMGGAGGSAVLTVTDVGRPSQTEAFNGTIEEVVFYNHVLEVPENSGEYIYNTSDTLDLSGSNLLTHSTRLFLCDYHNIRGKSTQTQSSTNQISWRATV